MSDDHDTNAGPAPGPQVRHVTPTPQCCSASTSSGDRIRLNLDVEIQLAYLDETGSGNLVITAGALTAAVRRDAETLSGVTRARVRLAGSSRQPTLRVSLSLQRGTDVREIWQQLDTQVLSRLRTALEVEHLPTAIHLNLTAAARSRVA